MNRLKEARERNGKTQRQMAEYLEMTTAAYANYETGRREPDFKKLLSIAEFLNVTVDYILGRSESEELLSIKNTAAINEDLFNEALCIAEKIRQLPLPRRREARSYIDFLLKEYNDDSLN